MTGADATDAGAGRGADATDAGDGGKRIKRRILLGIVLAAAIAMLAWSQVWFTLPAVEGAQLEAPAEVRGDVAAAPLMALALAGLAAVAGLALAGPLLRWLLGGLLVVLGGTAVLTSSLALADPARAASRVITELTGVSGDASTRALIDPASISVTPMPAIGIVSGVLFVVAGVAVLATARRWPSGTRRFEHRVADAETGRPVDRVDQWDALTGGDDPTGEGDDPRDDGEPPRAPRSRG